MTKRNVLIALVFILFVSLAQSPLHSRQEGKLCFSASEKELYDLLMNYRKEKGLPPIPVSLALTKVAQLHVRDLHENKPYRGEQCNFHSWSPKGNWSSCCYSPDHTRASCMWNKPRELAGFDADGFEIVYGSESEQQLVVPAQAMASWQKSQGHNQVMINKQTWKNFAWKSVGIGIHKNFACIWFSTKADTATISTPCDY